MTEVAADLSAIVGLAGGVERRGAIGRRQENTNSSAR